MPFREVDNPVPTQRTMMYLAGNVNEDMFYPYDFFGIDGADVAQILNATVGNFIFQRIVNIGAGTYITGRFFNTLADGQGTVVPVDEWKFSNDTIFVNRRDQFINLPIIAMQDGEVGAFQMILNMPSEVEVLNVTPGASVRRDMNLVQNIRGDEIRFSWITNSSQPISFKKGDVVANLVMKINRPSARAMRRIPESITFDPVGYGVWDGRHRQITDRFRVALPMVVIDNTLDITILDSIIGEEEIVVDTVGQGGESIAAQPSDIQTSKILNVIPNPMSDRADVTYSIAEPSIVTLRLFNLLGVEVKTLISGESQDVGIFRERLNAEGIPSGVYILRLETVSRGRREIAIEKIVVNR
jgi:hypothetical protein